jgi:hypothetical protein
LVATIIRPSYTAPPNFSIVPFGMGSKHACIALAARPLVATRSHARREMQAAAKLSNCLVVVDPAALMDDTSSLALVARSVGRVP